MFGYLTCCWREQIYEFIHQMARYNATKVLPLTSQTARVKISGTHRKCIDKIRQCISLYFVNLCHYKWGWGLEMGLCPLPSK